MRRRDALQAARKPQPFTGRRTPTAAEKAESGPGFYPGVPLVRMPLNHQGYRTSVRGP